LEKKGYYIKKERKSELMLNIYIPDFIEYLSKLDNVNSWVRFRIYERETPAKNGLSHNMEHIATNKQPID
jgi:hypothetical protein